MLKSTSPLP